TAVREAMAARSERTQIKADAVLAELAKVAFSGMRQFVEWGPDGVRLLDSKGLTAEAAACVAEGSQTVTEGGGAIRFKLHNKVEALRDLGRHLGLFVEKHEHTFPAGIPFTVADAEEAKRRIEEHRKQRLQHAPTDQPTP